MPAASLTAEARSLGRGRHAVRARGRLMFRRRAARSSRTSSARAGRSTRTSVELHHPVDPLLALALPRFQRPRRLAPLPLFQPAVLVVDVEAASGEPPLDEPTNRGAPTPAVQVAFADIPARIVDALKQRSLHGLDRSAARAAGTRVAWAKTPRGPGEPGLTTRAGRTNQSYGRRGERFGECAFGDGGRNPVFSEDVPTTLRGRPTWRKRRNRCAARSVRPSSIRTSN